jgi:acyl carrier protein
MEQERRFEEFREIVVDLLEVEAADVTTEVTFVELGADSIDLVELASALEKHFQVRLDEQRVYEVETVGELFEMIPAGS